VRATLEETFYNVDVTPAELRQGVGQALERARLNRKWKPIDVERAGGPSYKTVQAIENGDLGTVESLEKCARALGVSIVDVLYSVLASRETPLSPEAAQIVRIFSETTVAGRTALLALANALPRAAETSGTPPIPDGEATPSKPRPPRPVPKGSARRTAR
jgi:transcriptional regulator with XRE-family HTH domain